jgi:hypothetical protein
MRVICLSPRNEHGGGTPLLKHSTYKWPSNLLCSFSHEMNFEFFIEMPAKNRKKGGLGEGVSDWVIG